MSPWREACDALVDMLDTIPRRTMRSVAEEVAKKHTVSLAALVGNVRNQHLHIARAETWKRCHEELGKGYAEIGRFFGDRDHSTIIYGIRKWGSAA